MGIWVSLISKAASFFFFFHDYGTVLIRLLFGYINTFILVRIREPCEQ